MDGTRDEASGRANRSWGAGDPGEQRGRRRRQRQQQQQQQLGHDDLQYKHKNTILSSSNCQLPSSTPSLHSVAAERAASPDCEAASNNASYYDDNYDDFDLVEDSAELPAQTDGSAEPSYKAHLDRFIATGQTKYRQFTSDNSKQFRLQGRAAPDQNWDSIEGGSVSDMDSGAEDNYNDPEWRQAGENADAVDLAGPGEHGVLECTVTKPQKEGEGTQNSYISYLVITDTDFKSFQNPHQTVRRRFTDFVFLYKTLLKEYPQCAIPPLPDKHNMSYVRGDRFGADFTARRAHSLARFLKRLTLHPVLRRAVLLTLFLESSDWNAVMRSRPSRGASGGEAPSGSVLETWTDSFLNAFTKVHKTDKRFTEVEDRSKKLDEDLTTVSKTVARVAKRNSDLESDYADLATQFQKLAALEPGLTDELTKFSASLQETSEGWKVLKEHTDQDYLGSLKDMEAYSASVKGLMKTREQKQLDFEGLTEYLNKAALERDTLASHGGANLGASGFLRQKIEDVRGVDHEQARRERQRKLEVQIQRLTTEVEGAKKTSEAFDEEVVKEVGDFERIKAVEFRDALSGLADANIAFFNANIEVWEKFVKDFEGLQEERKRPQGLAAQGETEAGAGGG